MSGSVVHDDARLRRILADAHLGQLGEALGKIALGVRVMGRPPLAAGFAAVAGVHHAAVVEAVAKSIGIGVMRAYPEEPSEPAAELSVRDARSAKN
jgi:hypothetical protein